VRYRPLHDGPVEPEIAAWDKAAALFSQGKDERGEPLPKSAASCSFEEWHGGRPDPVDYMPSWPDADRTHYQMYETCSDGTPISPVFATPEDLARWLTDNHASAFGDMTLPYERWLQIARGKPTFGVLITVPAGTSEVV
jgi:hypothetical protein